MIIDIFFMILYLIIPILVVILLKAINLKLSIITLPSVIIISMFVFAYIGLLPLYFGWDEYRFTSGVQDKLLVLMTFLFSVLALFGLISGFIFGKYVLHLHSISNNFSIKTSSQKEVSIIIAIMIFCYIILMVYLSKIPQIAIFTLFSDGIESAQVARSLMGNSFSGKYHWYNLIIHDLFNMITYILFSIWLLKKSKSLFTLFIISFLGSSFSAIMATEKAPFVWLLIGLFMTYFLTKSNGKVPIRSIIKILIYIVTFLILFYIYFMGSIDILNALSAIISRAFSGSIVPAYYYINYFPNLHDFLLGTSFPNPGGIMPFEPYMLTQEIMNWRHPELLEKGIVGTMPTVFWGEAYANFGIYGIIIVSFIIGVFIWSIAFLINKVENTPIKIGFLVWTILHYQTLSVSGFSGFIIDFYMFFITLIFIIIIKLKYKFKYQNKMQKAI